MPFDPSLPANGTQVKAAELRGQFQGLHELITAISSVTGAAVDGVTTLPSGSSAAVNATLTGGVLHFSFSIPIGATGPAGPPGEVTTAQLNTAIWDQTANNVNGVSNLSPDTASATYNQAQMQAVINKLNELIQALWRI